MNSLDYFIVICLCIGAAWGLWKGLVYLLISAILVIFGSMFAGPIATAAQPFFARLFSVSESSARALAYLIAFICMIVAMVLIGKIATQSLKAIGLNFINRLIGAAVGGCLLLFICSLLLNLIITIDTRGDLIEMNKRHQSQLYPTVINVAPHWVPILKQTYDKTKRELHPLLGK